ncbi:MAG: MFS transporter [Patescibacteria group bacterium]
MKTRSILSLGNFFASAHFFLIIYVITPYLATFMPDSATGLVVSLGAIITLFAFPLMPHLVRKYGPRRLAVFFATVEAGALAWLAVGPTPLPAILLVALACATTPLIQYQLDLLLEATIAKEGTTGRIRTMFLTAGNVALVLSPLAVGILMDSSEAYWRVFAVAAASLFPFIALISMKRLPQGSHPNFINIVDAWVAILRDKDLRAVTLAHGTLQFFYHLAPLYIPLYLHHVLELPWEQLGWIFAIMLLPFVLLEYPAGWIADQKWGDQELLIGGFVMMASGFAALALVTNQTTIMVIVIILIFSRIGASLVEAMSEGHFFRRVSEADASTVGLFRMTRPVAALVAPIVGSIILSVSGYQLLFVATAFIIGVIGVTSALHITDIK